ncbi:MAG TPA: 16S rRNA (cytosine(967)-C(5))-methyltransferase RsmB [Casimicrobiaceae bacterium]|nr:16S rRNA (cytosine(967)-C(5))-methyltransferase RsmB [Casimicrobiaceae bacterium]
MSGATTPGLQASQRVAALAVARVLAGTPLPAALEAAGAAAAGPARGLVHELAYGTLRHWGTLDFLARALATRPIADLRLHALVGVALYQLLHANQPPFAVVDQAVDAAAVVARPAARGLVNAMLRRFLREREALVARASHDTVARWSHPGWWVERVLADWPDDGPSILAAGNARPPQSLRCNVRATTRAALLARFAAEGVSARAEGASGIVVEPARPVTELPGYAEGQFSVQDLGAQLAAPLLRVADGMRVLDACAAPGGKTTHVLELADVDLVALDSDASRLGRVRENLARLALGGPRVRVQQGDAEAPDAWWDGVPFDRVLADVPCTASGIVRRHPDGKWIRRPSDVASFAARQRAMLAALWPLVKPGGELLYVTCSVFREENEARVEDFLAAHPGALREPLTFPDGVAHSGGQLLPSPEAGGHNQDGFFFARLRKP